MGSLNLIDTGSGSDSPMDYNPDASTAKERLQNSLYNPAKAVKDSVENGSINITDAEKTIYENGVMPDIDTSREQFNFNGDLGDVFGENNAINETLDNVNDRIKNPVTVFPNIENQLKKGFKAVLAVIVVILIFLNS